MKQFLSTIVILLTLIFPTVSWGSVDGKGVICGDEIPIVISIFPSSPKKQKVSLLTFEYSDEEIKEVYLDSYETNLDEIIVYGKNNTYVLNRRNFELIISNKNGEERKIQCQFLKSDVVNTDEYDKFYEKLKLDVTDFIKTYLKKNRI